jgi:hypothetical protein
VRGVTLLQHLHASLGYGNGDRLRAGIQQPEGPIYQWFIATSPRSICVTRAFTGSTCSGADCAPLGPSPPLPMLLTTTSGDHGHCQLHPRLPTRGLLTAVAAPFHVSSRSLLVLPVLPSRLTSPQGRVGHMYTSTVSFGVKRPAAYSKSPTDRCCAAPCPHSYARLPHGHKGYFPAQLRDILIYIMYPSTTGLPTTALPLV